MTQARRPIILSELSPPGVENIVAELWKRRTGRSHAGSA